MTRYIAKPVSRKANLTMAQATRAVRAWFGDDVLETSHELNDGADYGRSITVFETDREPVETGLVDHRGVALYRVDDDAKIGFDTGKRK